MLGEPGESWLRKQALPWLASGGLPGLMLAVGILLVFMVPLVALLQPPPTRFGFQMYSGLGGVQISVQDVAGGARELSLADFAAQGRGELDWTKRLPEFICDTEPQVVTVHVRQSGHERTLACAR